MGAYSALPLPPNHPAAKFTSSDAHLRTDTQIKFLYYPLIRDQTCTVLCDSLKALYLQCKFGLVFYTLEVLILSVLSCFVYLSLSFANETSLSVANFLGNTVCLPSLNNIDPGGKSVAGWGVYSCLVIS